MSTRYGKNFTNFQNVGLTGSPTSAPVGVGMIEMAPGATNAKSTVSISMIGGSTVGSENGAVEHPYLHVSNAGLSAGTGFIRLTNVGASPYGTIRLRATYLDTDTAYQLPAKSGTFGVMGTFIVQLPAVGAGAFGETNMTVTGIREEDALVVTLQDTFNTVTTDRGFAALIGARPYNGNVALTFFNFGNTATIPNELICAYCAMR